MIKFVKLHWLRMKQYNIATEICFTTVLTFFFIVAQCGAAYLNVSFIRFILLWQRIVLYQLIKFIELHFLYFVCKDTSQFCFKDLFRFYLQLLLTFAVIGARRDSFKYIIIKFLLLWEWEQYLLIKFIELEYWNFRTVFTKS